MTASLVRYDAACRAMAEAISVDEVRDIRDKAEAMRIYARQAKNHQLEIDAAEIRMRAERRLGEIIKLHKETIGLNKGSLRRGADEEPRDVRPTLADAGIDKKLSARAQRIAAVPHDKFEHMIGEWRGRVQSENERVTTSLLREGDKRLARDQKEAALSDRIRAAAGSLDQQRFGLILADPPWRFEPYSRETGMDRAPENHYPTMTLDEIEALTVPAADDCVLFLWATAPMLPEALAVMNAWGFTYKSHLIWVKDRIGTGYWARNKHEILLIGTKGNVPAPAPGTQPESTILAAVSRHSEKPAVFHGLIESLFPNLPKIELFARQPRKGWATWGAEAETSHDPETGEIIEPAVAESAPAEAEQDGDAERQQPDGLGLQSSSVALPNETAPVSGDAGETAQLGTRLPKDASPNNSEPETANPVTVGEDAASVGNATGSTAVASPLLSRAKASEVESGMAEGGRSRKTINRQNGLVSRVAGDRTPAGEDASASSPCIPQPAAEPPPASVGPVSDPLVSAPGPISFDELPDIPPAFDRRSKAA